MWPMHGGWSGVRVEVLGHESFGRESLGRESWVKPFFGVAAGARTHDHRTGIRSHDFQSDLKSSTYNLASADIRY